MCVSRCLRCVGLSLIPLALVCVVSNVLLLLPELSTHFLREGHVTREATWATGLWGGGFLVLVSARAFLRGSRTKGCWAFRKQMVCLVLQSVLGLLAAAACSIVSIAGLSQGPFCLYNTSSGTTWGVPLQPDPENPAPGYLYNHSLWSGVCLQPRDVVQWNVVLFGLMGGASFLQVVIFVANVLNSAAGLILGQGFCHNKVSPVPV